jgi:hypothetical protein
VDRITDLDKSQKNLAPVLDQASSRIDATSPSRGRVALGVRLLLIGAATLAARIARRSTGAPS